MLRRILSLAYLLGVVVSSTSKSSSWIHEVKSLFRDCPLRGGKMSSLTAALTNCARSRTLLVIDQILDDDVVPIVEGLKLVKFANNNSDSEQPDESTPSIRELLKRAHDKGWREEADAAASWREHLTGSFIRALRTHAIKVDLEQLDYPQSTELRSMDDGQNEARGNRRRRRRQMQIMPIILMSVLLMSTVLIPMGFQFLAVLGGKALVLAKMALMLSSIQGLKKVATNGVNYGLHYSPGVEPWHERNFDLPTTYQADYSSYPLLSDGPHQLITRRTGIHYH
ncbi:hypothetical protein TKK_0012853 [Trichogramma kaykai]|uniref:Uncharacterized protein n=1 Tax=Trichogramma kaykai TaxID=54128 RepID=A0ABD2WLC5_9HYME